MGVMDREKVIKDLEEYRDRDCIQEGITYFDADPRYRKMIINNAIVLLKEQEKKQITLHKKHVITWGRSDEFSMRKLYEAICETLLDEGELFIARTDDHEKVDFVFYVAEGR